MRGALRVIAASGGSIRAVASDLGDIEQTASVLPILVPLGSATVTVPGGASPTNAVITLTQAVPGLGTSASIFDDEFSTAPWMAHRTFQTGDKWAFAVPNSTDGASDQVNTWWANPIATPQAAPVYPPPANGVLSRGLMNTPAGIGIAQPFIGTIMNDLLSGGGRLFGYHEFRVRAPNTPGILFQWDIEDFLISPTWNMEIDFRLWIDGAGTKHIHVQMSGATISPIVVYQSTTLDITQFHIYGINWQSDHITVYVDGNQVGQALNPGGPWLTNACFAYILTTGGSYFGQNDPAPGSLPAFAQIDYYRLYSNLPTTSGTVLVHAYNAGSSANTITDSVGQIWLRHPDSRIGGPPVLTALAVNIKPMPAGSTITVGFTNSSANTQATAEAWYAPNVNATSFGSLANVGSSGALANAPSITASGVSSSGAIVFVTLPAPPPVLDAGVIQVQYRTIGSTTFTSAPSPPQYCTPGVGNFIDSFGNTWSVAANGNPVINTTVTDTASHAQFLLILAGVIWQFDGNDWYSDTPAGTITSTANLAWTIHPGATSPLLFNGIALSGLLSGTQYDLTAFVTNISGPSALAPIINITTTGTSNATFFDDFNSLNMWNIYNHQPGQTWQPSEVGAPDDAGKAGGQAWVLNPFNPATQINNIYTIANGILTMRVDRTPPQFLSAVSNCPFLQAELQLAQTFSQTYGYFEARMAIQNVGGTGAGFLLYSLGHGNQIDVIQINSDNNSNQFQAGTFALWDAPSSQVVASFATYNAVGIPAVDCTQFHQYGVYVTPTTTSFYIDRVIQGSWPTPAGYNVPLYPLIYMGTADPSSFYGLISNTAPMPVNGQFDYVGIWTTPPFSTPSITSITLSNTNLTLPVPAGTTVGTLGVTMSTGTFSGTLSQPGGADGGSFTNATNVLKTSIALANARPYAITETATQAGVSNSPFTQSFNINVSPASTFATGPAASSNFITADFTSPMNIPTTSRQQVVTQKMNGCFIGWGGDPGNNPNLGPRGPDVRAWSAYSSSTWTSQAARVNFGVLQVTGNLWGNGWFNSDDTVNHNGLDNLINNFYKIDPLGVAGIMWGMNWSYPNGDSGGNNGGDPTRYAKAYKNLAQYIEGPAGIMPNGKRLPLIGFGSANEPDHSNPGLSSQFFNAFVPAVKAVNPNYLIAGPQYSSLYRGDTQTFLAGCNPKPDGVNWDAFPSGSTSNLGSQVYTNSNFTNSVGDSIASGVLPSGYTPKFSCGMGNTTFNCSNITDVDGVNGAMFWAMNWFNGLAGTNGWDVWMGAWDDGGQGSCGIITDQNNFALSAAGYLFGMQVRNLFGPRWQVPTNSQGLPTIATTPGAGRFGLLIINPGFGGKSGTVALSHWPVNSSGTGTINMWQMTNSVTTFGQDGNHSTVSVTNGLTTSINFPDPSVTLLYV